MAKIRAPAPEVIVDVYDRYSGLLRPLLKAADFSRHGRDKSRQLTRFGKCERVDDVNEQKSGGAFVRCTAVKILIAGWHLRHSLRLSCSSRKAPQASSLRSSASFTLQ